MPGLQALRGAVLDGVWLDAPGHRVIVTLRADRESDQVSHTLVLEGVTDFSFFDDVPEPWAEAQVADIATEHEPGTMRLDVSFETAAAGLAITCAKGVLHRNSRRA
ncbi:hypothetical protein CLV63_10830 [Murinocardiopsis flavida]|uniref:Immunity protein 50 of polymorphic toxin system n=1 Tax=Murinocardiopsis flavida TaxID=645275 RepID=A0A2P8DJA3_9ACTN|nr:hypothetical protein [Murinocardiopsis flavida]PSK97312.1 hypothetical protein CLV63_10830 [Murinocardiopsis flavida]